MDALKVRLVGAVVLAAAWPAWGDVVDLTTGASGTIGGALFERGDFRPGGTGTMNPFVRLQNNGTEQGYNTSGRPVAFNEMTSPNFTRNLQVSGLPTINVGGTEYYEFRLDINEPAGGGQNLLSLDALRVYTSAVGGQTTTNVSSLGVLKYDLDAGSNSYVKLDANLTSGSGQGDMVFYLPTSVLAGVGSGEFVYVYSAFGDNFASEGGFEEWAVRTIPLPPAAWAGGIGLVTAAAVRRRIRPA